MKKLLLLFLGTAILLSFSLDLAAQYQGKKKNKKKENTTDIKSEYFEEGDEAYHKLWYEIDLNPGVAEKRNYTSLSLGNSGNTFNFGLSPMLGYKFSKDFSLGPRFGFLYKGLSFNNNGQDFRISVVDYSLGVFSRFNFLKYFFAHAEIENRWDSRITGVLLSNDELETEKVSSFNYYLGAGIGTIGKRLSFNAYLLYNLSVESDFSNTFELNDLPLFVRLGVRYHYF